MIKLSRSPNEFFENSGWSAKLFLEHAKQIHNYFGDELKVGRTVVHLNNCKIYVHHNGRSREYMTICDKKGNELHTFHYSESPDLVLKTLIDLVSV
jgi:hypothetical protein